MIPNETESSNVPPANVKGGNSRTWLRRGLLYLLFLLSLVVWHRNALDDPPTPDQVVGIWLEGNYLAETNFDYRRLFWEELPASKGGPRTYMFSVLPTVVAIFVKLAPEPQAAVLHYHLFCIANAALALLILFELLLPFAGWIGALFLVLATATTPLFSAQVALAGMEMPLAALTMLTVYLASKDRYLASTLSATTAFFVKSNALVLLVANLACIALRLWSRNGAPDTAPHSRPLVLIAIVDGILIVALGLVHLLGVLT